MSRNGMGQTPIQMTRMTSGAKMMISRGVISSSARRSARSDSHVFRTAVGVA